MNFKRSLIIKPRFIISISVIIAVLMIASAIFELTENKNEIYHLLDDYSNSLVYIIDKSSANTVVSDLELENLLSQHLLGVARNVKRIDSIQNISNSILKTIAEENEVFRINIFDVNADKIFSNFSPDSSHMNMKEKRSPMDYIGPILRGEENEIVIGFKEARFEKGNRFAIAVRRGANREGAIVVNLDAESFLEFRNKIGFGKMIQDIGSKSSIEYIVLQNEKEILAANKPVDDISSFNNDVFLKNSFDNNITQTRVNYFQNKKVFEVVKPFIVENEKLGVFRVALSMDEVNSAEARMYRRAIIITIILIIISVIVIGVIVSSQNYRIVSDEYRKIQTFTGNILDNMSQAVMTTELNGMIKIFNKSSENLFKFKGGKAIGTNIKEICPDLYSKMEKSDFTERKELDVEFNPANHRIFEISKTLNLDSSNHPEFITYVISDITESRRIENQAQQNEKLIAMGELASAVAHEVRNPLNAINMIAQRYEKEYSDKIQSEDFRNMNNVLQSESKRINIIIEEFLRFARPPKLNLTKVNSRYFLNELKVLFEVQAKARGIEFILNINEDTEINIDVSLIKQALINLLNNASDSTYEGGKIELSFYRESQKFVFEISDNGTGISEENIKKIFNLYFTTKAKGTGLGLSIVQQIVSQHNGTIFVDSSEGKGTKFTIEIPINKK
ncbi:MAG TPA: ATP-binding protein [Ignavibacteria bacterium]